MEKCFKIGSCVDQQDCLAVSSFVDIQIRTGALLPMTLFYGGKSFKNIILFFIVFLKAM